MMNLTAVHAVVEIARCQAPIITFQYRTVLDLATVGEPKSTKGQGLIFLNFLYVHGNCTAVIRFVQESMHGNYPDACKISMHVKSLLQTRIMHGIRI